MNTDDNDDDDGDVPTWSLNMTLEEARGLAIEVLDAETGAH
jgi:hypothetical protein